MFRSCVRYVKGFQHLPRFSSSNPLDPIPPAERQDNKTVGLNLLINRVYLTTGASFLGSIFSTFMASSIPYFAVNPFICIGLGGAMAVAGYVPSYFMKPEEVTVYEATRTYIKTVNSFKRLILYSLGCAGIGVACVPFSAMISAFSPYFINNLMALTIGSFGGASLLVTLLPKIKLFKEMGLLGAAVGGFIAMNISSLINKSIYGVNFMSNWMQTFDTYVGVIVFFFLISYNTRLSKEEYAQGKADHLGISMRFLYDFLTFIRATIFKLFKPSGKK